MVHTPEELGANQRNDFESYLSTLEHKNVVLDLDNTEALDSEGLAALLEVQERLRCDSGDVKIAATNVTNRKIFEITRLDQQLEVFDSVVNAVKSFQ